MKLEEKEAYRKKRLKHTNLFKKTTVKRYLQILDLKPLRQQVKEKNAFYRQEIPESSCVRKETVDRKIMQSIRITSRPPSRIRKWNPFSQFRWRFTKVIPIQKTYAGYILTMSKGFMRDKNCYNCYNTLRQKKQTNKIFNLLIIFMTSLPFSRFSHNVKVNGWKKVLQEYSNSSIFLQLNYGDIMR